MSLVSNFQIAQVKSEFHVNNFDTGNQLLPDIFGLSNGGFVTAYNDGNVSAGQIVVEFFDTAHRLVGSSAMPDDGGTKATGQPQVVELASGNVLICWSDDETGDAGPKGRLYTADGEPLGDEINLAPGTISNGIDDDLQITALTGGGFVLTITEGSNIYQARYSEGGVAAGGAIFQVNAGILGDQIDSSVASLSTGGYVVTYTDSNPNDQTVRARIYDASGNTVMADKVIAEIGDNTESRVIGLDTGNWAVVYRDAGWGAEDSGNSGITLQIFDGLGESVSGFIRVNAPSS